MGGEWERKEVAGREENGRLPARGGGAVGVWDDCARHDGLLSWGQNIALYISRARCANLHATNRNAQHFLRIWLKNRGKIIFIIPKCATPARNTPESVLSAEC
jgi:hypothetical protein